MIVYRQCSSSKCVLDSLGCNYRLPRTWSVFILTSPLPSTQSTGQERNLWAEMEELPQARKKKIHPPSDWPRRLGSHLTNWKWEICFQGLLNVVDHESTEGRAGSPQGPDIQCPACVDEGATMWASSWVHSVKCTFGCSRRPELAGAGTTNPVKPKDGHVKYLHTYILAFHWYIANYFENLCLNTMIPGT